MLCSSCPPSLLARLLYRFGFGILKRGSFCSLPGSPGLWLLLQQLQPPGPSRPLVVPGLHLRPARRPQVDRARLHRGLHCRQDPAGLQGHVQERGVGLRGLQAGQGGGRQGQLGRVQVGEGQQQQAAHYAQGEAWHGQIRSILTSLCSEEQLLKSEHKKQRDKKSVIEMQSCLK